ncbi:MAG: SDR family oxidoreductase [Oceanospirillaceae bacterium]|nr:SDR family oxidoreductase [Oceanospirillaceae bacterium]
MNRVAIITGGGRGIGAATARLLAQRDYDLCINYRHDRDAADALVSELAASGGRVFPMQADIAVEDEVVRLFERVDAELGPVDALVNNAGILLPQMKVERMSAERINRIFSTNVTGTFLCCREAIRRMARSQGGRGGAIINVSSVAARLGAANEYVDYAASKGAIDTLTRGLSLELAGEGIRVNAVRPGFIDTRMHADGGEPDRIARVSPNIPMQRGGRPEEVATAIAWLLSDEASYVTGSFVDVGGGR